MIQKLFVKTNYILIHFDVCRDVRYQWLNISRMIKLLNDANLSKDNKTDKDIKECEITCFN